MSRNDTSSYKSISMMINKELLNRFLSYASKIYNENKLTDITKEMLYEFNDKVKAGHKKELILTYSSYYYELKSDIHSVIYIPSKLYEEFCLLSKYELGLNPIECFKKMILHLTLTEDKKFEEQQEEMEKE